MGMSSVKKGILKNKEKSHRIHNKKIVGHRLTSAAIAYAQVLGTKALMRWLAAIMTHLAKDSCMPSPFVLNSNDDDNTRIEIHFTPRPKEEVDETIESKDKDSSVGGEMVEDVWGCTKSDEREA